MEVWVDVRQNHYGRGWGLPTLEDLSCCASCRTRFHPSDRFCMFLQQFIHLCLWHICCIYICTYLEFRMPVPFMLHTSCRLQPQQNFQSPSVCRRDDDRWNIVLPPHPKKTLTILLVVGLESSIMYWDAVILFFSSPHSMWRPGLVSWTSLWRWLLCLGSTSQEPGMRTFRCWWNYTIFYQ